MLIKREFGAETPVCGSFCELNCLLSILWKPTETKKSGYLDAYLMWNRRREKQLGLPNILVATLLHFNSNPIHSRTIAMPPT